VTSSGVGDVTGDWHTNVISLAVCSARLPRERRSCAEQVRASAHAPTSDAVIAKPLSERAARQRPGRGRDSVGGLALLPVMNTPSTKVSARLTMTSQLSIGNKTLFQYSNTIWGTLLAVNSADIEDTWTDFLPSRYCARAVFAVDMSVCHHPVLYQKGLIYRRNSSVFDSSSAVVFWEQSVLQNSDEITHTAGALDTAHS